MKTYFFTFGGFNKPEFQNTCAMVIAKDRVRARELMQENFESEWAFQYGNIEDVHPLDRNISVVIIDKQSLLPKPVIIT